MSCTFSSNEFVQLKLAFFPPLAFISAFVFQLLFLNFKSKVELKSKIEFLFHATLLTE